MIEWLSANWVPLLGGGSLTAVINYLLFGKTTKEKEFKKTDIEIESAEVDLAEKVRQLYDKLEEKWNLERIELINEKSEYKETIKTLSNRIDSLQEQFNNLYLSYSKEVEKSQYWMQKYDELDKKYNEVIQQNKELLITNQHLEKLLEGLQLAHDKLQDEFNKHKKILK